MSEVRKRTVGDTSTTATRDVSDDQVISKYSFAIPWHRECRVSRRLFKCSRDFRGLSIRAVGALEDYSII